jgi:hypothetical protein
VQNVCAEMADDIYRPTKMSMNIIAAAVGLVLGSA